MLITSITSPYRIIHALCIGLKASQVELGHTPILAQSEKNLELQVVLRTYLF